MTYSRLITRNYLTAYGYMAGFRGYPKVEADPFQKTDIQREYLSGEFRRMEVDEFEPTRLAAYERVTGIPSENVAKVLRMFFGFPEPGCTECEAGLGNQRFWRCQKHSY